MTPFPHRYTTRTVCSPGTYAIASGDGLPDLRTAPPEEFGGPGDAWSPEHLLVASVETCFAFTFRALARVSKIDIMQLEIEATGIVARQDGVARFSGIVLRPTIVVAAGTDRDGVLRLVTRSERACLVSASLAFPVVVEPQVREPQPAVSAVAPAYT